MPIDFEQAKQFLALLGDEVNVHQVALEIGRTEKGDLSIVYDTKDDSVFYQVGTERKEIQNKEVAAELIMSVFSLKKDAIS